MSPHSTNPAEDSEGYPPAHTNGFANGSNGFHQENANGSSQRSAYIRAAAQDDTYDLVCVGFGPASLAIAVALHDYMESGKLTTSPKVLFLEKQPQFAWHAGMLLPGAKMQISFIKDLASLRDPRSSFTFLNYLHKNERLVEFTNLSTFLPARVEYEDYLRWCAGHFEEVVKYNSEVVSVSPIKGDDGSAQPVENFAVASRNVKTGSETTYHARNVIVAVGGRPALPKCLPAQHPRVIHSSQYEHLIKKILSDKEAPYRVAVLGAGQSAAEIFSNIQTLYPNSHTSLIMRSEFLKPSDDSPFVNSIFNPAYVDELYPRSSSYRHNLISDARSTNYGVVRLELIERLYEKMYEQRRELGADESRWPHRILGGREIVSVDDGSDGLRVHISPADPDARAAQPQVNGHADDTLSVDLIIAATGYRRDAHVDMLKDAWPLLPAKENPGAETERKAEGARDKWMVSPEEGSISRILEVGRDYGVRFSPGAVANGSGIWLQGCCEGTHGLSDTLLSVLATRSGDIVDSIFRPDDRKF